MDALDRELMPGRYIRVANIAGIGQPDDYPLK